MKAYLFHFDRLEIDQVLPAVGSVDRVVARLSPRRIEGGELLSMACDRINRHLKPTWRLDEWIDHLLAVLLVYGDAGHF